MDFDYPVVFSESVFHPDNEVLSSLLLTAKHQSPKVLVVIDDKVDAFHPSLDKSIKDYISKYNIELVNDPMIISGGEAIKSDDRILDQLYRIVAEKRIDRHSFIIVIGGGALIDAVGYVAATAHRGVRLIRMPTTVLSQNDAGIGVKNGINYLNRKNFLGTFSPPYAVINDVNFLSTLDKRDQRSGMAEAVKVALIKDDAFFDQLYTQRFELTKFDREPVKEMIIRCAELHLDHICSSGDPFEMGSARPLDFGHWAAHRLEVLSAYGIRHGEAVACGILLDSLYSLRSGTIQEPEFDKISRLLLDLGFSFDFSELGRLEVRASLEEFREHLGGTLSITLLSGIGRTYEANEIDIPLMDACLADIRNFSLESGLV